MKDTFQLTANIVSKVPIVFKVFLKKLLELYLYYQVFGFKTMLILISPLYYYFIEKPSNKKDIIRLVSSSSFKIIFILLAKVVAIQVWIYVVKVR